MANQSTVATDLYVAGALSCQSFSPPAGCVTDQAVPTPSPPSGAIQATKLQQQRRNRYQQSSSVTVVTDQAVVALVGGTTGTVLTLKAGMAVANVGAATVVVDLLKNGSSILTSTITLNNSLAAYALVSTSSFTATALVAGDVLEIKITATAGGGTLGKGVFAQVSFIEDPS
jgi:hypothetical protein